VRPTLAALILIVAALAGISGARAATPLCDYDVVLLDQEGWSLDVAIECRAPVDGFAFTDEFPAEWVALFIDAEHRPLARGGGAAWRGSDGPLSRARYLIDLDGMADAEDDYDSAKSSGQSIMADLSGILAVPIGAGDETLAIHFRAPHGGDIATSLPQVGDAYEIRAEEVDYATSVIFGRFERRKIAVPLPLSLAHGAAAADAQDPKGEIELVILDGPLKATDDEIVDWVHATALANADLWRGFPVARSIVAVIPVPGRANVPFGRVVSTGGIMIRVMVGADIEPRALYDEWVLVHEFIHLGTPYIRDTGAWLNEGLATYLEPIVRYRAGWRSAESVWEEWTAWMGRGLEPMRNGLRTGNPYWGGALYWLMADVELRRLTDGRMGIEDCLRVVLAESGDISVAAPTMPTLALAERDSPEPVLTELARKHLAGAPVDLVALFDALGVKRSGGNLVFEDSAPLAEVRRWLLTGGAHSQPRPIRIPADP
jgi:hypothetical protein